MRIWVVHGPAYVGPPQGDARENAIGGNKEGRKGYRVFVARVEKPVEPVPTFRMAKSHADCEGCICLLLWSLALRASQRNLG